jgi:hypothetical protein
MIIAGSIISTVGGLFTFVSFWQIGEAGDFLESATK